MAERTRERDMTVVNFDDGRPDREDFVVEDVDMAPDVDTASAVFAPSSSLNPQSLKDGLAKADEFAVPVWLSRKLPLVWSDADICQKNTASPGRNCCLFAPLSYCNSSMDVINGFCAFHLRALFNLTYQNDALYQLNAKGQAVIWFRTQCFVVDPRPVDDRMTPCFPFFELFDREPNVNDISLFNLERYLVSINAPNWEKIYAVHVNFLHRLITIHSNFAQPLRPSREDQLFDNQLIMHWNVWNEYYSWVLKRYPAELYVFHMSDRSDEVKGIPISKCTTLTQMIARLFSESYTRLDDNRFLTGPSTYGVWVRGHLAYSDNLCSYGTTTTPNVTTIGALATLPMLRTDVCKKSLIHYDKGKNCQENFCINSRVNHDNKGLNRTVLVSGDMNNKQSSS